MLPFRNGKMKKNRVFIGINILLIILLMIVLFFLMQPTETPKIDVKSSKIYFPDKPLDLDEIEIEVENETVIVNTPLVNETINITVEHNYHENLTVKLIKFKPYKPGKKESGIFMPDNASNSSSEKGNETNDFNQTIYNETNQTEYPEHDEIPEFSSIHGMLVVLGVLIYSIKRKLDYRHRG